MKEPTHYHITYKGVPDIPGISTRWVDYLKKISNDFIICKALSQLTDMIISLFHLNCPDNLINQLKILEVTDSTKGSTFTMLLFNTPVLTFKPVVQ